MNERIEQVLEPFEIDHKRFKIPGCVLHATCPCGAEVTRDFGEDYLAYPDANGHLRRTMYHGDCGAEWSVMAVLTVTLALVAP